MALSIPEFLQTKTYSALRDRLAFKHGGPIQAGVWLAGDLMVTQRGAGANMSVDVASGYALVDANDPGNDGLYHLANDATVNVTITPAHATLPRIDQVCIQVNDTTHGADATDTPAIVVLTGTATSGATLNNRTGAASLPAAHLRLADVLVGAAASTITNTVIRDRRPWARGAYAIDVAADVLNIINSAVWTDIGTPLRVECSGAPVRLTFEHAVGHSVSGAQIHYRFMMDGSPTANMAGNHDVRVTDNAQTYIAMIQRVISSPSPTTHTFGVQMTNNVTGNSIRVDNMFTVEEILRQYSANNTVTSG